MKSDDEAWKMEKKRGLMKLDNEAWTKKYCLICHSCMVTKKGCLIKHRYKKDGERCLMGFGLISFEEKKYWLLNKIWIESYL